jgi:hypothetical protein
MFYHVESITTELSMLGRDTGIRPRCLVTATVLYMYPIDSHISADGKTVAYFRGRKLHGKQLKVPKGYRGVVVSKTDRILSKEVPVQESAGDEEAVEEEVEVKIMEEQSEFEDIMVWGHEALPDNTADPYVRGMEEWIAFAEQVCVPRSQMNNADNGRFIRTRQMISRGVTR